MTEETYIALANYDWMIRTRGVDDVSLAWESMTLIWGEGGSSIEDLLEPGFTPATHALIAPTQQGNGAMQ